MATSVRLLPRSALLLSILLYCTAQLEAKSLKYHSEAETDVYDFDVLNSDDPKDHKNCDSLRRAGYNVNGVYRLSINKKDKMMPCEFRDGKAYTVILRRVNANVSFIKPWAEYEVGFGDPEENFWAGLENMHHLTNADNNTGVYINMTRWPSENGTYYISWKTIRIDDKEHRYTLYWNDSKQSISNWLHYNNQMPFSTYDNPGPHGCACGTGAGFWYYFCTYFLPTGIYYNTPEVGPHHGVYDSIWYEPIGEGSESLYYVSWALTH